MQTFFITGAAGFIGCNFARHVLAETDARVVVFDKLTYAGHLESLEDLLGDARFTFVQGDIADADAVNGAFREHPPDAVVNFAAESHVDRSIDDPTPFLESNTCGVFVLLEAARRQWRGRGDGKFEGRRFLHVSTDEVYGTLGETGSFREDTPYAPNSPYSATKAAADHLVRAWHETYGLPTLITNCSNNYGPYQYPEKLISLSILNLLDGKPVRIYGDGGNIRDWLHVEDHCAGILEVLRRAAPGSKYNIGGNSERTNLQVIDAICSALEAERPAAENSALRDRGVARYEDLKTFVADRPGHDRRYAIDASRIRADLGWKPSRNFEQGIRETVRWYIENRNWCGRVLEGRYDRGRIGLGENH